MKPKKPGRKLALSKTTIANLEAKQQNAFFNDTATTEIYTGCGTWHPACPTMPEWECHITEGPRCVTLPIECQTVFC
jgi:hypothetical protein